jgi:hypothetical protein
MTKTVAGEQTYRPTGSLHKIPRDSAPDQAIFRFRERADDPEWTEFVFAVCVGGSPLCFPFPLSDSSFFLSMTSCCSSDGAGRGSGRLRNGQSFSAWLPQNPPSDGRSDARFRNELVGNITRSLRRHEGSLPPPCRIYRQFAEFQSLRKHRYL